MDRDRILLTPGPLTTTLRTKLAMLRDWGSWDADFNAVTARVRASLLSIVHAEQSHVVVPLQGSGTFSVEAAIATLVPRDGHVLVLDNGAYCKRAARLTTMMGRRCTPMPFDEASQVSPAALDARLAQDASITHVVMIHCETGAGVWNPLQPVADVCARHGKGLIVDAMSSFAALPIDARETRFDALVAASGKCLEGVPGMGFVFLRKEVLEVCAGRSQSLAMDLHDQYVYMEKTGQWRFTPPTHVVVALAEAIAQFEAEGGQPARLARYTANYRALIHGMARLGFKPFLDPSIQAPIIVTFHAPGDARYDFKTFYAAARERGFLLYPGKLTQVETFRVGCIGAIGPNEIGQAVQAVARALQDMGIASGEPRDLKNWIHADNEHASALEAIRKSGASKVKVACSDIDGILRGKYLHKDKFEGAAESGFGFCDVVFGWDVTDSPYDNAQVTGWQHGFPDALARLDLDTHRNVPWDGGIDFFLGEFINADGSPYAVCPRQTLKRVLARAEKLGFQVMTGMEYEWFNFRETPQSWAAKKGVAPETLTPGMFGYSLLRVNQNRDFFNALMDEMLEFKVPIEGLHTETGPGVYEAALGFSEALQQADRAILFKTGAKEIGARFGIMPSFMAKWSQQYPGCSGHIHQSLSDGKNNLFFDGKSSRSMSKLFESYLAGQVLCLMEFAPMFWPTINSYKRLVDGFWAPVKPTWGLDNRTASFRVIAGSPKGTRLETRCPGADVNPYLAMAAVIAAGIYGVENNLQLTAPPITGTNQGAEDIPRAPRTLIETTRNFSNSKIAREMLGDTFVDHFAATRDWEWRQWLDGVTDWELKRYFEII